MREPYKSKAFPAVIDLAHPDVLSKHPEYGKLDKPWDLYWACCKELGGAHLVLNYEWADHDSAGTRRQRNRLIGFWAELNKLRVGELGWGGAQPYRSLLYRIMDEFENLC